MKNKYIEFSHFIIRKHWTLYNQLKLANRFENRLSNLSYAPMIPSIKLKLGLQL